MNWLNLPTLGILSTSPYSQVKAISRHVFVDFPLSLHGLHPPSGKTGFLNSSKSSALHYSTIQTSCLSGTRRFIDHNMGGISSGFPKHPRLQSEIPDLKTKASSSQPDAGIVHSRLRVCIAEAETLVSFYPGSLFNTLSASSYARMLFQIITESDISSLGSNR